VGCTVTAKRKTQNAKRRVVFATGFTVIFTAGEILGGEVAMESYVEWVRHWVQACKSLLNGCGNSVCFLNF
jgi:hypothetical protein